MSDAKPSNNQDELLDLTDVLEDDAGTTDGNGLDSMLFPDEEDSDQAVLDLSEFVEDMTEDARDEDILDLSPDMVEETGSDDAEVLDLTGDMTADSDDAMDLTPVMEAAPVDAVESAEPLELAEEDTAGTIALEPEAKDPTFQDSTPLNRVPADGIHGASTDTTDSGDELDMASLDALLEDFGEAGDDTGHSDEILAESGQEQDGDELDVLLNELESGHQEDPDEPLPGVSAPVEPQAFEALGEDQLENELQAENAGADEPSDHDPALVQAEEDIFSTLDAQEAAPEDALEETLEDPDVAETIPQSPVLAFPTPSVAPQPPISATPEAQKELLQRLDALEQDFAQEKAAIRQLEERLDTLASAEEPFEETLEPAEPEPRQPDASTLLEELREPLSQALGEQLEKRLEVLLEERLAERLQSFEEELNKQLDAMVLERLASLPAQEEPTTDFDERLTALGKELRAELTSEVDARLSEARAQITRDVSQEIFQEVLSEVDAKVESALHDKVPAQVQETVDELRTGLDRDLRAALEPVAAKAAAEVIRQELDSLLEEDS